MIAPLKPRVEVRGFSLIELLIAIALVSILMMVAVPSYFESVKRSCREAAQSELLELSSLQEKIFLNSNAYSSSVSAAYNGSSTGGLGVSSGKSRDGKYQFSVAVSGASFTLTATPVPGTRQAGDGNLTLTSDGTRTWGSKSW
jgi:type IV pilus assembly protein PilE